MCSYCGCEAEPLISALTEDHAAIADLVYRLRQAIDQADPVTARFRLSALAERFSVHSLQEEAGLFAELTAAGEAETELARLVADHARLRPLLASPALVDQPGQLRNALADLEEHAQTEDNDLFPYALQALPTSSWNWVTESDHVSRQGLTV